MTIPIYIFIKKSENISERVVVVVVADVVLAVVVVVAGVVIVVVVDVAGVVVVVTFVAKPNILTK